MDKPLTYADAGVDISEANRFVEIVKEIAKSTPRSGVMGGIGGFGGLFSLNTDQYERPVLVSSTDGVGTKLKICFMMDKHDTIGFDLVAMSVNDIAVQGAKPLFFLDYLSMGRLDVQRAADVLRGIAAACRETPCALLGGETAEMPGLYQEGEYDLAGFAVGIVDNAKIIDGSEVGVGHVLVGIASSGLHSNGYSLVRKICFERLKLTVRDTPAELGQPLGDLLLTPTRIYSETIRKLIRDFPVHGLANITGGGIVENLPRTIPRSCKAVIRRGSWEIPPIFRFLQEHGNLTEHEMMRTFNSGLGLIAVVPEHVADDVVGLLHAMQEKSYIIGEIAERKHSDAQVQFV